MHLDTGVFNIFRTNILQNNFGRVIVFSYTQSDLRFSLLLQCSYFRLQFKSQSSYKVSFYSYKNKNIVRITIVCLNFVINRSNTVN